MHTISLGPAPVKTRIPFWENPRSKLRLLGLLVVVIGALSSPMLLVVLMLNAGPAAVFWFPMGLHRALELLTRTRPSSTYEGWRGVYAALWLLYLGMFLGIVWIRRTRVAMLLFLLLALLLLLNVGGCMTFYYGSRLD